MATTQPMHIRKSIFFSTFIFLSILFANTTWAQTPVTIGIRAGVNFNAFYDANFSTKSYTGYSAGFFANYHIPNSQWGIQPEVLYSRKGAGSNKGKLQLDYIEVPVLARYNFRRDKPLQPFVYAGPYIGFLVHSDLPYRPVYFRAPSEPDTFPLYNGDKKNMDGGIVVGGGISIGNINVGLRYEIGFNEVSDDEDESAKNGAFSIIIGTNF